MLQLNFRKTKKSKNNDKHSKRNKNKALIKSHDFSKPDKATMDGLRLDAIRMYVLSNKV